MRSSFFSDLMQAIAERGRQMLPFNARDFGRKDGISTCDLCDTLLSSRGEASGMAIARDVMQRWEGFDAEDQLGFMTMLLDHFGPDSEKVELAIDAYRTNPDPRTLHDLHTAAEPRRQELIRRLNLAPKGIATLVSMREKLLAMKADHPELEAVDDDFAHLLGSWFNRGFLVLKPINWSSPADVLEKVIRYEAVHQIDSWDELRRRLAPEDRRCFAFFHPQLVDDPLIFVEVALMRETPEAITEVLEQDRDPIPLSEATTAVFYSISNCQVGLRGISFGNFLIKQVVEELRRELPQLETFVTLSPVPGFAEWLTRERRADASTVLTEDDLERLRSIDEKGWAADPETAASVRPAMLAAAASYFLSARNRRGKVIDPVARFHLGNGARLERINFLGDPSDRAMRQAHGLMVNYLYKLDDIEINHEAFAVRDEVVTVPALRRLLREREPRSLVPVASEPAAGKDNNTTESKRESV